MIKISSNAHGERIESPLGHIPGVSMPIGITSGNWNSVDLLSYVFGILVSEAPRKAFRSENDWMAEPEEIEVNFGTSQ